MSRPLSFLPHLALSWREEIRHLNDRLQRVSTRLGTPAERDSDFTVARQVAQRLKTLQLALVGLSALTSTSTTGGTTRRDFRRRRSSGKTLLRSRAAAPLERHIA